MNGLKVSMLVGVVGIGLAGGAQAALTGTNLDFEADGVSNTQTGWTETSLGSDALDANDFRVASDPDNWFPDSTAGTHVLLLEGDNGNEFGSLGQALTGTAEAGTYTFSVLDVGVTNFADNNGAEFNYGFSLDGTTFIAGSFQTLTEGGLIDSPDNGGTAFNGSVTYNATGGEAALHILIATTGAHTGRSVPSIGSTTVTFVPEPGSLALLGLGGLALLRRRRA